ncbi:MAG: hypothetical protein IJM30_06015 [Thermoguttaceae bacterium]|nr:hypothetical protein [Thermoguttaceae bacterium]
MEPIRVFRFWATFFFVALFSFEALLFADENRWAFPERPSSWARNTKGFSVDQTTLDGKSVFRLIHRASTDWAISLPESIKTEPGQIFKLTAEIKNVGKSPCQISVVLYDSEKESLAWVYGATNVAPSSEFQLVESTFIVPEDVATIVPRVVGSGDSEVCLASYSIERIGAIELFEGSGTISAENDCVRVDFDKSSASFSILDRRTGRTWTQRTAGRAQFVQNAEPVENGARFKLIDARTLVSYVAEVRLEPDAPELVVKLIAPPETPLTSGIEYPYPFQSIPTDRVVLPVNEGVSFPATEEAYKVDESYTFGGHGLCMAFWAIVDDKLDASQSSGLMGIIETPDDTEIETKLRKLESDGDATQTLAIGHRWLGSMRKFAYDKRLRIVAIESGGYVAACGRYREYAKQIGLYVPFDEKIRRNPNLARGVDLLVGAANIWNWDGMGTETVPKLREIGFDHILWSKGGSPEEIEALNEIDGVLTSRYDIYQDVMNPARYDELPGGHADWVDKAWPKDLVWDSPDGHWTRGWEVDPKEKGKPRIPCGVLCDSKAIPYAESRIDEELKKKPYRARFLDTTVASPWRECWNPDHPMTRTECKKARMELLGLLGSRFDLVCGSETGIDASVPYCDFYEGMTSIGPYRCPESGRYIEKIWDEVPDDVEKYQFGEKYRLPLFELVYHGCVVSYWYWGDHNNKFPKLWRKRDLFNALYGTPPMYGFTDDFFEANRERFAESYKIAEPVSRLTGRVAMTDHQILTEDRSVQKTVFANGVEVVVNFGNVDYVCDDGVVVPPESSRVIEER